MFRSMFRSVMDQHFIIEMKTKILQCNGHSKVSTVVAGGGVLPSNVYD